MGDLTVLKKSTNNISDTNTYSTGFINVEGYESVIAEVFADVDLDCKIEFSEDESNIWAEQSFSTTANEGEGYKKDVYGKYARLKATNNSGGGTSTVRIAFMGEN